MERCLRKNFNRLSRVVIVVHKKNISVDFSSIGKSIVKELKNKLKVGEIWGSHGGEEDDVVLLVCDV
jgi:hypothetical protein